jgi:hypothetical protein
MLYRSISFETKVSHELNFLVKCEIASSCDIFNQSRPCPLSFILHKDNITMTMMSQLLQTTFPSSLYPLDCAVECGNDDERNQYVDLWMKNSFGQSSMECTEDSTNGAEMKCIQFPWKLHEMLDNAAVEGFSDIVSWLPGSTNSFKVHQPGVFAEGVMPRYFKKIQFKSFRRQINMWGFERIKGGAGKGGYRHPNFIRGMPSLCCMMKRVKIKGAGTYPLVASNAFLTTGKSRKKTGSGFTKLLSCNLPGKSSVSPIPALRISFPAMTLRKS